MQHADLVISVLKSNAFHMQCLSAVQALELPDWAIGAGFVRNAVWGHLHGYCEYTPLDDVDVLYFDPQNLSKDSENSIEAALVSATPEVPWSVRNQARMHIRNGDPAYKSTEDAMRYWLETPTCVAARLSKKSDHPELIAPYGLEDLVSMKSNPTLRGIQKADQYLSRMYKKAWHQTWPMVEVRTELSIPLT